MPAPPTPAGGAGTGLARRIIEAASWSRVESPEEPTTREDSTSPPRSIEKATWTVPGLAPPGKRLQRLRWAISRPRQEAAETAGCAAMPCAAAAGAAARASDGRGRCGLLRLRALDRPALDDLGLRPLLLLLDELRRRLLLDRLGRWFRLRLGLGRRRLLDRLGRRLRLDLLGRDRQVLRRRLGRDRERGELDHHRRLRSAAAPQRSAAGQRRRGAGAIMAPGRQEQLVRSQPARSQPVRMPPERERPPVRLAGRKAGDGAARGGGARGGGARGRGAWGRSAWGRSAWGRRGPGLGAGGARCGRSRRGLGRDALGESDGACRRKAGDADREQG